MPEGDLWLLRQVGFWVPRDGDSKVMERLWSFLRDWAGGASGARGGECLGAQEGRQSVCSGDGNLGALGIWGRWTSGYLRREYLGE